MKKQYEEPIMKTILANPDVIATSGYDGDGQATQGTP